MFVGNEVEFYYLVVRLLMLECNFVFCNVPRLTNDLLFSLCEKDKCLQTMVVY